ncbi:MAG: DUF1697 domain-containing protein [Bacteroidota bacterium]
METYIAFLRGINVSGQKKIKMADLRNALELAGLEKVQTYIQSGNLVFKSKEENTSVLENVIREQITRDFGFDVPVMVMTANRIAQILEKDPFKDLRDMGNTYYVLLKMKPDPDRVTAFEDMTFENEQFVVTDTCVYLYCTAGYGKAKLNNNFIERKLKVAATTRNLNTLKKMMALADH